MARMVLSGLRWKGRISYGRIVKYTFQYHIDSTRRREGDSGRLFGGVDVSIDRINFDIVDGYSRLAAQY